MYAGNAALLAESLEVIQRTSAVILEAITEESTSKHATHAAATPETRDEFAEVA